MDQCSIILDLSGYDSEPRILIDIEQLNGLDIVIEDLTSGGSIDLNVKLY